MSNSLLVSNLNCVYPDSAYNVCYIGSAIPSKSRGIDDLVLIQTELVEELAEIQIELNEEETRGYLKQLGILPSQV